MRLTFLGTGTSHGIPVVGCGCPVCRSRDPRNGRTRASVLVRTKGVSLLIDTATEFRLQALREGIRSTDAILFTHAHADHLHGLDDIRPLCGSAPIPVYGSSNTLEEIRRRFDYIFHPRRKGGGIPRIDTFAVEGGRPFSAAGVSVTPVPVRHGGLSVFGYRIGGMAYLTDCSEIPESSFPLLEDLDLLVLGALRYRSHETHFSVPEALAAIERISPRRALLTHFCHDIDHGTLKKELPRGVAPSYDGLTVRI